MYSDDLPLDIREALQLRLPPSAAIAIRTIAAAWPKEARVDAIEREIFGSRDVKWRRAATTNALRIVCQRMRVARLRTTLSYARRETVQLVRA